MIALSGASEVGMARFGISAWFEAGPEVAYEPIRPLEGAEQLLIVHLSPLAYGHPDQLVASWAPFLGPIDDAAIEGTDAAFSLKIQGTLEDQIEPETVDLIIPAERLAEAAAATTDDESEATWQASLFRDPTLPSDPLDAHHHALDISVAAAEFVFRVTLADASQLPVVQVRSGSEVPDQTLDESWIEAEDEGLYFVWGAAPEQAGEAPHEDNTIKDAAGDAQKEQIVDVFFATDRQNTGRVAVRDRYCGERGTGLEYGVVEVNIPGSHSLAKIERPFLGWRRLENPDKHVMLLDLSHLQEHEFFGRLASTVAASGERQLFIFVHGYNVTFEDAALRAGQMAFDFAQLGVDALPVLYSWPSAGAVAKYVADQEASGWSAKHFADFLAAVTEKSGATSVHVIAHSMGNQVAARGLERLALMQSSARVSEYVLAAPDIDVDDFIALASDIRALTRRMTLYAHSDDKALDLSEVARAGRPRAGDAKDGKVLVLEGVHSVDASTLDAGFLDHSYFGDTSHALADMGQVMAGTHPNDRTLLSAVDGPGGQFWKFK